MIEARNELLRIQSINNNKNINTSQTWTLSGQDAWFGQTVVSHDGEAAGRCGFIGEGEESVLTTQFTGPGKVVFGWSVSSALGANSS